ncbi:MULTISPECIES: LLM class flavin-dependent oxidoreductase [Cupriavidus]|uniref:LLM class flavin-dependent oxidoreductase n=1 Tax=Cupriavidus TaxID=106589 RepID=UPI001126FF0A|nr:LLM class flavin-dependent oxidoreductase [Cupriavidus pinatubonensis]TPQ37982.1 5,10-methylene tetrahydromethanopterin reductase [Cupriavidus pinatubonensis]
MAKQIRINAFDMNTAVHQSQGLWRHPRDRSAEYTTLEYWQSLAKTLEKGKFDGIFLADVTGIYDVYGGNRDAALRNGVQVPNNDPFLIVPAMAAVTQHLGFGVTGALSYEPPYTFARKMSTLDHLTNGRVGWNIVTGYLNSAAKASGATQQASHDVRYDIAEEYMQLMYKLWEGSWEDGAVRRCRETGVYVDPSKVHPVQHDGEYFRLDGIHLSEPSRQRTPVLYQAGTSPKGQAFAGKHAECVFVSSPTKHVMTQTVKKLRAAAVEQGRNPEDVIVFAAMNVIVGRTEEEAQEKLREYRKYASYEGALTLMSGWTGIDFSSCDPNDTVKHIRNDSMHTAIDRFTISDPNRVWTVGEVAEHLAIGGSGPVIVGSVKQVADELQQWVAETDIDGFNLAYTVAPESIQEFVDLVVPELQARGVYKTEYTSGTLREKLFGGAPRLVAPHPAAEFRR